MNKKKCEVKVFREGKVQLNESLQQLLQPNKLQR